MSKYPFSEIEKKWQKYWDDHKTFKSVEDPSIPEEKRAYVLDMFPYPSGAGLHVGHPEGYTATDIYCRYLRMNGYSVLHPMGFDSFGLPAENYAIKTGTHPRVTTHKNIDVFRRQIKSLGLSYDWDREVSTCEADYYKWTQWIFLKLYEKGKNKCKELYNEIILEYNNIIYSANDVWTFNRELIRNLEFKNKQIFIKTGKNGFDNIMKEILNNAVDSYIKFDKDLINIKNKINDLIN